MFKVPDHQVAGHRADGGTLGPLVDDLGRFYKPLQSDQRGDTEVAFYNSLCSNTEIPSDIRELFPVFHGTQIIEASDGSGPQPHMVLEDLVAGRVNPSVMDIKMGSRTWYPEASEKYIQKCLEKDRKGTSVSLGFRISGLKAYQSSKAAFWQPVKKVVDSFNADDVRLALRKFVSSNLSLGSNADPDCLYASTVYSHGGGILAQLSRLKQWFEVQTNYHFYSCSILIFYDGESALDGCADPKLKLVDFAHVVDGHGVIDHNFLGGLCSLIKFIGDIVDEDNKCTKCEVKLA
ncbi:inositol polyphosphate multikinase beta-like [Rhodamnia argentea]|uniref:Inositol polyphosphate multikinase n=1 Tax=Rhodamnia argentea TaxID=178133 RepID=A0A8B8PEI2_9MYRT|nr:inositol polyphosphate multikinase beta-like [Rhodamnia argentea]XP_030532464.2 inositol polyphosphate multikinase beta-like [Rhodamnia argentea]